MRDFARHKGVKPFLHFEIHGAPEGLEMKSGEFVTWKELPPALAKINETSKNQLFITLATCHGAHMSLT